MDKMAFWCCNKNKVEDEKSTVILHPGKDSVFVYASINVLTRSLLGSFIQALEKKGLFSSQILFKSGEPAHFPRSNLFKTHHKSDKFSPLGVFMVWTGENSYARVTEVVHRFGNQHTVPKVDILFTTTPTETKKEMDLWFGKEEILKKSPEIVPTEAVHQSEPTGAEAAAAVAGTLPVVAVHEDVPAHPEEPVPTYEDAATAEAEALAAEHEAAHEQPK